MWADLEPELGVLSALEHAGLRPTDGQNEKRRWSEKFANGCAVAVADAVRETGALRNKRILPVSLEAGVEPLTPLGGETKKRIDVTVADPLMGLEIGISLKGLNFRDSRSGNFDKNLTGRMYELSDEVRLVHEHLPHAFMVGVFFLPLESTNDKIDGNSSFANAVLKLRARTSRLDPALHAHASRCDMSFVALYSHSDSDPDIPEGIVQFFDVRDAPPRRGRPQTGTSLSLRQMIERVVDGATHRTTICWADPE